MRVIHVLYLPLGKVSYASHRMCLQPGEGNRFDSNHGSYYRGHRALMHVRDSPSRSTRASCSGPPRLGPCARNRAAGSGTPSGSSSRHHSAAVEQPACDGVSKLEFRVEDVNADKWISALWVWGVFSFCLLLILLCCICGTGRLGAYDIASYCDVLYAVYRATRPRPDMQSAGVMPMNASAHP